MDGSFGRRLPGWPLRRGGHETVEKPVSTLRTFIGNRKRLKQTSEMIVAESTPPSSSLNLQDQADNLPKTLIGRGRFFIEPRIQPNLALLAAGALAVANTIACLSQLLDPVSIVLGLTHRNLMKQSLAYLIWGEGETGLAFYSILVRRWELTERNTRPLSHFPDE